MPGSRVRLVGSRCMESRRFRDAEQRGQNPLPYLWKSFITLALSARPGNRC